MIIINYKDRRPIYEQVVERFKELIIKGALEPNSQLPSVRSLAMDLSINPNTIQRAYAELERQGFIYSVKGKGSFTAANDLLSQQKRNEILRGLEQVAMEARSIGISEEDLISKIKQTYKGEPADD
ncbi:MAG: GntR family transcriptional regulator [Herbinix sp.]|jgi:GntR family transcriptional regulator|nr:GntR family transcriptional regulator [Herbinix sp.]